MISVIFMKYCTNYYFFKMTYLKALKYQYLFRKTCMKNRKRKGSQWSSELQSDLFEISISREEAVVKGWGQVGGRGWCAVMWLQALWEYLHYAGPVTWLSCGPGLWCSLMLGISVHFSLHVPGPTVVLIPAAGCY